MNQFIIDELEELISVISLLQYKEAAFREDLEYFFENVNIREDWAGPLKRLEHEIMFLCIDVYSLHVGISKKKSVHSKIFKQYGKQFTQVDKSATATQKNSIFLGIIGNDGMEDADAEVQDYFLKAINELALSSRKTIQKDVGIKSSHHSDMDDWMKNIVDEIQVKKLEAYRNEFAHRLDSLDNLKRELTMHHPDRMKEMIDAIASILESYIRCFRDILSYATPMLYEGIQGFHYDSIPRIRQWNEMHS